MRGDVMAVGMAAVIMFITAMILTFLKLVPENSVAARGFVVIPFEDFTERTERIVRGCVWDEMSREVHERREILLVCTSGEAGDEVKAFAESLENVRCITISQLEGCISNGKVG